MCLFTSVGLFYSNIIALMKKIFLLTILIQSLCLSAQTRIFVNQNIQGGQQDGSSWNDAFPDLQQALAVSMDGDEIWVSQGTYYPTTTTDRSISFVLKNGVKMYGGFLGSEPNLIQRDFELNETILSGNIGLPKGSDNSYHVLYGQGLDSTTVLDGFVVTKGVANGTDDNQSHGGGLLINPSAGAYNTCPIIQNCRFESNNASIGGGIAIIRWEFSQNYANPIIQGCQFVSNRATLFGGGLAKIGPALMNQPFILNKCTFSMNSSKSEGGGIFFSKIENGTILRNCAFEKDTSKSSLGGGIYLASGYEAFTGAILTMDSCLFKENIATEGGGLYYLDGGNSSFSVHPFSALLSCCVFEKNVATNGYGAAYSFIGFDKSILSLDVEGCEFIGNLSHTSNITYFQGMDESNCSVFIKNSRYIDNRDLENPESYSFAITLAVGGVGSRLEAKIENCLFAGNGGGVSTLCTISGARTHTYISNCTFIDNNEFIFNKSYYSTFNGVNDFIETYVNNCLIWEPGADLWTMFSDNDYMLYKLDGYHVNNSLLSLDSTITNFYPIFGDHNISETDPLFVNVANGDFRLEACSPAVNAGNNLIVDTSGILTDLEGNPRIRFDTVDIGAYETQDSCFTIGSKEPNSATVTAMLSQNPASPGSALDIQVFGLEHAKIEWVIRDAYGREISSGNSLLIEKEHFSVVSPEASGIYFIELRAGQQSVWLKFVVQQ